MSEFSETSSATNKKEYLKNYQREKKETIDKELGKLNDRMGLIIDLMNSKNTVEVEMQGDTFDWSFTDIKYFLKQVGDIAAEKCKKYLNNFNPKEKQKYFRLDKYNQILQSLRW
jgi:hypothetical protein